MSPLLTNDILVYPNSGQRLRLLRLHEVLRPEPAGENQDEQPQPSETKVASVWFVIDIDNPHALPFGKDSQDLTNDLLTGNAHFLKTDPFLRSNGGKPWKKSFIKLRNRAWDLIKDMVQQPQVFFPRERSVLVQVKKGKGEGKASKPTLYGHLRRYWQRGQTPNALLPDYLNCGAKGAVRICTPESPKRGRPRKYGDEVGINASTAIRNVFKAAIQRYGKENAFTLRGSYDDMVEKFFTKREEDPETGEIRYLPKRIPDGDPKEPGTPDSDSKESGIPTFGQFKYWFYRENDSLDLKRRRVSARVYDKDLRGYTGTATTGVWGPGARYVIDATIADVYVVSRLNRRRIVGRPVLYVVIDTFSRMIVGIYIGLEGPSWVGAMMALANAAADKVAFCAQYNIPITQDDWPCQHLCTYLLGDRGEMESHHVDVLSANFNVMIENAAAYRADWKGIVESRFLLLPAKFKPYTPGYIKPDYRVRGGNDYRLDAVLDLDDFTRIFIACVLRFNNHHELAGYDPDRGVLADAVKPVPLDLWNWGIVHRSGALRRYPEELVKFSLMPTGKASVTTEGIKFQGAFYSGERAMAQRWFDQARQGNGRSVDVSYDPRGMDEIYVHGDEPMSFDTCSMTDRSRALRGLSLQEIDEALTLSANNSANHRTEALMANSRMIGVINSTVEAALAKQPPPDDESDRSRVKGIRENRAQEKNERRAEERFRLGPPASPAAPTSSPSGTNVLPFTKAPRNDYDEPDITELDNDGAQQ